VRVFVLWILLLASAVSWADNNRARELFQQALWDVAFAGTTGQYWTSDSRPPGCPPTGFCQLELDFSTGVVGSVKIDAATLLYTRCVR
jgi:hypothetical protein